MPTLALMCTSRVRITNGEAKASLSRRVSSAASSGRLMPVCRIRNSSLSSRASSSSPRQPGLEPHRDLAQQLGAELLAEGVVDALEPVEIEMQQGQHLVLLPGPGQLVLEAGAEMLAARQAGERVLLAAACRSRPRRARSSVTSRATVSTSAARPEPPPKRCLGGQQPARAVEVGQRVVVGRGHGHAGLEHLLVEHAALQRVLLAVAFQERQPQRGGAVDAEQALVGLVDHDQPAAGIDHRDGGRHGVEHALQHLLLGAVVARVQLALEVGRALGQQQLLAAQGQEVAGPGAELEMVDRAEQEVGGAGLERPVAELAVLIDGDRR